jgi:hypothetical protein
VLKIIAFIYDFFCFTFFHKYHDFHLILFYFCCRFFLWAAIVVATGWGWMYVCVERLLAKPFKIMDFNCHESLAHKKGVDFPLGS